MSDTEKESHQSNSFVGTHRQIDKLFTFGEHITQTCQDTTHVPNWNALREFLGESDFIYIADCKLCSQKNMDHIHEHGGLFITIVPKNRSEVKQFYEFLKTNPIQKWLLRVSTGQRQHSYIFLSR